MNGDDDVVEVHQALLPAGSAMAACVKCLGSAVCCVDGKKVLFIPRDKEERKKDSGRGKPEDKQTVRDVRLALDKRTDCT